MITASIIIPVMGPRITALGERDFISPQIIPARQISPFVFQTWRNEIIRMTENVASMDPEKGRCRLWRRLPTMISKLAQSPPAIDAFNHMLFNSTFTLFVSKA